MSEVFISGIVVFVLAAFVGLEVISKVPPTLHTPLMSGANAISGITIVGAVIAAGVGEGAFAIVLGFLAVTAATINVVGGFLVTDRVDPDDSRGARAFRRGCELGSGRACAVIARFLTEGRGTASDEEEAVEMLERACRLESADACVALA
ncbi:MAG: hypothetical protein GY704_14465, partial [Phycisphaeraceae bacterium]|nr:hypothetical protein [Phycisphaeraceae bacterium]